MNDTEINSKPFTISPKTITRQIVEIVLIFMLGGFLNGYLSCPGCYATLDPYLRIWAFSGTMWVLLWKGNELITCEIDKKISWVREPGKRFLVGVVAMLVYTLSGVFLCTWFFFQFVLKSSVINISFRGSIIPIMIYSIGITLLIMLIFLSRNFLMSWRQVAISEEKLRRENIASQYEALKNQVNPHFLFNTLNALSSLIYENQEKAVEFINKFSDVYRYVLESKDKEVVPIREEITFVKSFIYLLVSRYEKNLEVIIDESINEGYVPPMAIQLLVENAVKHNIISDKSHIKINIRKDLDFIVVENNLNIKDPDQATGGLGLENIKSRYSILSDKPVRITNDSHNFSVSIPILEIRS